MNVGPKVHDACCVCFAAIQYQGLGSLLGLEKEKEKNNYAGVIHHKHGLKKRRRCCRTAKYSRYQADLNPRPRRVWPDHGPLGFQGSYPAGFSCIEPECWALPLSLFVSIQHQGLDSLLGLQMLSQSCGQPCCCHTAPGSEQHLLR
jgi:hypothetical protein